MQRRCALHVVFTSLWLILLKVQDVVGSGHFCLRSSPAEDRHTRVTFLRQNAGVRSLYLTVWSEDLRLVTCEINTNPLVTESYDTFCKSSSSEPEEINQRYNISIVQSPDAPCTPDAPSAQKFTKSAEGEGKVRRKRSWIFPGTLWCGHGSHAGGYEQLGMFEAADRCCREHDYCNHIIPGMTVNYGVFNTNFYTVSHCDCDQRFQQCLLSVNDTISTMVGYSYFNILRVPCFELKRRRQCTEMYWWGKCKVTKEAAYATFKNSRPYNKSDTETKFGDKTHISTTTSNEVRHVTESPVTKAPRKFPKDGRKCVTKDPPRGDTFFDRKRGKGCKRRWRLSTAASSQRPPLSSLHTSPPTVTTRVSNAAISNKLVLNEKKRVKNKSNRKGLSADPAVHTEVTTVSYPQTTSTTQSTLLLSQSPAPQHFTAITTMTKTMKSSKKLSRGRQCCRSTIPVKGDASPPQCRNCPEQKATTQARTARPATTRSQLIQSLQTDTSKRLRSTATSGWSDANNTTELKTASHLHYDGKAQKKVYSHMLGNHTSQHINIRKHNYASSDDLLLCGSLKHLDKCKYKIPPLEKKYDLQNFEAKTAYHCDCTSRFASHIQSIKEPTAFPPFMLDSVSQYCFKLPKEKKCRLGKSCSGGFTKAFDLLQALKKIEGKDIAGVQNSGKHRKRRIFVRLYKRCLRLRREAMARLT